MSRDCFQLFDARLLCCDGLFRCTRSRDWITAAQSGGLWPPITLNRLRRCLSFVAHQARPQPNGICALPRFSIPSRLSTPESLSGLEDWASLKKSSRLVPHYVLNRLGFPVRLFGAFAGGSAESVQLLEKPQRLWRCDCVSPAFMLETTLALDRDPFSVKSGQKHHLAFLAPSSPVRSVVSVT
jgi:hypothetical protein